MTEFKVGDLVKITKNTSSFFGQVGSILQTSSKGPEWYVGFQDNSKMGGVGLFYEKDFELYGGKDVTEPKQDMVNNPAHYGQGSIECIDYIEDFLNEDEYIGYLRGNIAKYLHRWRYKNGLEDLKKAQWYLDRLIKHGEPK